MMKAKSGKEKTAFASAKQSRADQSKSATFAKSSLVLGTLDEDSGAEISPYSPLEFDTFIPWVCKKLCVPTDVSIIRKGQAMLVKARKTTKNTKSTPTFVSVDDIAILPGSAIPPGIAIAASNEISGFKDDKAVPVKAYYDAKQQLVEISIVGSPVVLSREVILAFGLSVPYHPMLTRFTFRRSGLTAGLVYEINKLLSISNISEIIFDDSYVPEGNYYILLEQNLQLKYLSLNRCKINNEVCKKIFEKIIYEAPARNTLKILELGSNDISDDAAIFIGSVLRSNRCLVHLNLSGNQITDSGFIPILDSLMEFPIKAEEKIKTRRRKIRYLESKQAVYARCISDLKSRLSGELDTIGISGKKSQLKRLRIKQKKTGNRSLEEDAEIMARGILGEFSDPFLNNNVEFKDGLTYSKGNFVLCSINIAYNHLDHLSVQRLWEVLRYQDGMSKSMSGKDTGLIRITLDGNTIPQTCSELDGIEFYLNKVLDLKTEWAHKKRSKSSDKRIRRSSKVSSNSSLE